MDSLNLFDREFLSYKDFRKDLLNHYQEEYISNFLTNIAKQGGRVKDEAELNKFKQTVYNSPPNPCFEPNCKKLYKEYKQIYQQQ